MEFSRAEILDFWKWFSQNSNRLHSDNLDKDCVSKLDTTFSQLNLSWELGPGINKAYSLAISGNRFQKMTRIAKEFIELAPSIDDWEFLYFRLSKEKWYRLMFQGKDINALTWQYILLQYPNDKLQIMVKADNIKTLTKKDRQAAIELVLINLLGEETYLANFFSSKALDSTEEAYIDKLTRLEHLPDHLKQINGA